MFLRTTKGSRVSARLPLLAIFLVASLASAQRRPNGPVDPGPRGGAAAAGSPLAGVAADTNQLAVFTAGLAQFSQTEAVKPDGLGPKFNSDSCVSCHIFPAAGGSSPAKNPQAAFANSQNRLPSFITANGPIREARFIHTPNHTPDGGVHSLFTIAGRADAVGCNTPQEDFSNTSNISLRIPTPTFGLGLIESIPDATLVANLAASSGQLGIAGSLNRNGNDGTITRFGWKAQNKSLLLFAGEAYNVEMGITNFLFPNERDDTAGCNPVPAPNNIFNLGVNGPGEFDDITVFAAFMRFLAPPARGPITPEVAEGESLFTQVGCAHCHTATLQTGLSPFPALSNQTIHPFSDFAIHHMGPGLADQIGQGLAGGDQFRSAPLWGAGQRLFFFHDGRENDLVEVIAQHASNANSQFPASEANAVVNNFNLLSARDQQAIVTFLRSL